MTKPMQRIAGCVLAAVLMLTLAVPVLPASAAEATEEAPSEETTQEMLTEATEEQTEAVTVTPTDATTEAETEAPTEPQTEAPTEKPTEPPTEPQTERPTEAPTEQKTERPTEPPALPFDESETVDGVTVTVTAEAGVFPAGATLSVTRVNGKTEDKISKAVQTENGGEQNVALSYAFDIKVVDADGEELQPADGAKVTVSFETEEVADRNLSTQVYHVSEDSGTLVAEQLDTTEDGSTITAETDGFSYYTVEFTYNSMQYVMEGDSKVPLSAILDEVGLTGVVTEVSVSNEDLFSVHGEAGTWMVYAHQAFSSEEWMRVTINGVAYEITVTDATLSPWTFHNSGWGETWYIYCPQGSMYSKFSAEKDGVTKVAYCLNRDLSSPGPSVKYQTETYPTTKHYKVATIICALGYPSNSIARINEMWGYDLTAIQAQQATQVAIGAAQKALAEGWTVDKTYDSYVGSRSGYQSVYDYSKKLCARALELVNSSSTAAKYTIAVDVTNALTTSKLAVTITPYRAYGQYKIVIKNLPSGTLLTTGQNTRVVESDGSLATAKNKAVSGTVTIRGLGGASGEAVGKFTLSSIPKGSSDRSISVTATSFAKLAPTNEVEWGKSPDSSHQNMFIAGLAEGTTVTATKSATVPKLPVGSITVIKKDVNTGANLSGCVFGLRKYDGSTYVDTGKTATSGSDGKATFSSLATDTTSTGYYQVYEKTAPAGYEADSKFYCSFRVGSGWYSYVSTLAGNQSGTLADGGTVNATVSGVSKPVITVSKSGDNYSATVYLYDNPKPPDTFNITLNKRDLSNGNAITGATYQLYVTNSSGSWTQFKSGTVNSSGTVTFTGLKLADSANGKFRVIESAMSNSAYRRDASFEVIVNPSTGAWSYKGSFISNQSGTFTSTTTVKGTISLPGGGTASRSIISTAKDDSLYDFTIWQDDQRSAEHHLTVKKVVNVAGSQLPVSGMTFTLMRQNGSAWASVGTLTETTANSGIYQAPETSTGWTFSMVEGGTYKVVETTASSGVVNSGWESPTFVWSEGTDLNLSYTVQNSIPTGHIGILKVNSATNAPIAGVGFKITAAENIVTTIGRNSTTWYSAGEVVMEGTTDANGRLIARELPYGKYTITETSHPANYAYANVKFTVTVGAPSGYTGSTAYSNPMIGYVTYPSGMNVTTVSGLRYVTVGNTPIHPDMAVSKLTERTVNSSGTAVAFNATTGCYTQTKVPGTYYNGQNAKFTLTATNTGDVDLHNVRLVDVMSESLWTVVRKQTGTRTTDVTFRQVNSTPLALGNALAVGNTVTTRNGKTAKVTAISYDDATRTYEITFDKLEPGDSVSLQITFTVLNSLNINQQNLPNDVYLYSDYKVNGTQGSLTTTPGGGEGDCHDVDKLNVVSQGRITVHKRSADGTSLSGVHFELKNANSQKVTFVRQSNGDYAATVKKSNGDWVSASASGQTTTTGLVTDSSGTVTITELPEGPYSLVETRTVSGQTLLKSPVSIVMPTVKSGAEIDLEGNIYFSNSNHFYALDYTITNSAQFRLPATGGSGHLPAVLFGLLMLSGLFLTLIIHHRKGDVPHEKTACAFARHSVPVYNHAHPLAGRRFPCH